MERELHLPRNFNPPSPCGEGRFRRGAHRVAVGISIHPPRVGRDWAAQMLPFPDTTFQSTLPVWGGTCCTILISLFFPDFNPPSPCGEGLVPWHVADGNCKFQSTLPVWGGTSRSRWQPARDSISIHPPRVGRDLIMLIIIWIFQDFNPPSPCGEGLLIYPNNVIAVWRFQSTLPVWGGTVTISASSRPSRNFNPPSPCGEGPLPGQPVPANRDFNPPSPCGEGPGALSRTESSSIFQSTLPVWGGTGA